MCGITGVCWRDPAAAVSPDVFQNMIAVLSHRGPDDVGMYDSRSAHTETSNRPMQAEWPSRTGVQLGHRRLSIIDLGKGKQPLSNEDGTVWVIFNGEIYNFRELHVILKNRGHRFQTESDTEVIVHLYEDHGSGLLEHLRGMFAFALWDARKQRLMLARDRVGQKPLLYRWEKQRLLFASELKSLLQVPGIERKVVPQALDHFLTYRYIPHPLTILDGFQNLPPGHFAIYQNGKLKLQQYWSPPYRKEQSITKSSSSRETKTKHQWQLELRTALTESVRLRMRSDVPMGAFLSGGIDSTIITGLMQELSQEPVRSFSIGFPIAEYDEREFAREASHHLGTVHHEKIVSPTEIERLPKLIWHYDQPFADSSAIPTMALSEMTKEHVTVALSGDGGDELFAGYDRYKAVKLSEKFDRLPQWFRKFLSWNLWQKIPASINQKTFRRRLKRFLATMGKRPEERYFEWVSLFSSHLLQGLYSKEFRSVLQDRSSAEFLMQAYQFCPERDFITRTTCADFLTYLPCDILHKVDIASMSVGLECRSPFMDHQVSELAATMPIEFKMNKGIGKKILIDTFSDLIPISIQKRAKMGFGVPLGPWFRDELKETLREILLDQQTFSRGYFDSSKLEIILQQHFRSEVDQSEQIWALLCLELWHRMFIDQYHVPQTPPDII